MTAAQIEAISSRQDFVAYLRELRRDLAEGKSYWQNTTLDSFLDAMTFWTENLMDAYFARRGEEVPQPSWRLFAEILESASMYE